VTTVLERTFRAVNEPGSPNLVHDDVFARRLGYPSGLVPGVDVYALMAALPVELWGETWLARGSMSARFSRPVFDGEELTVAASAAGGSGAFQLTLEVRNPDGLVCASGMASLDAGDGSAPDPASYLAGELPVPPPPPSQLAAGRVLGTLVQPLELRDHAWPARLGNAILVANCDLPPWMHVESRVAHLGLPRPDETVSVRGLVASAWERKGHSFVDLDLVVLGEDLRPLCRLNHVAIVELAQLR
jgi:hypothetical protein